MSEDKCFDDATKHLKKYLKITFEIMTTSLKMIFELMVLILVVSFTPRQAADHLLKVLFSDNLKPKFHWRLLTSIAGNSMAQYIALLQKPIVRNIGLFYNYDMFLSG